MKFKKLSRIYMIQLKAGEDEDNGGWDGWMASPTQWTWVWANPRRWWRAGKAGMLQSMESQRVGHDWSHLIAAAAAAAADLISILRSTTAPFTGQPLLLLSFSRSVMMDCSMTGFPVLHHLSELAQTYVHWVSDAIQPSHPLLSPSVFPSIRVFSNESALCIR